MTWTSWNKKNAPPFGPGPPTEVISLVSFSRIISLVSSRGRSKRSFHWYKVQRLLQISFVSSIDVDQWNDCCVISLTCDFSSPALVGPCSSLVGPSSALVGPSSSLVGPSSSLVKPCSALVGPSSALVGPCSFLVSPCSVLAIAHNHFLPHRRQSTVVRQVSDLFYNY